MTMMIRMEKGRRIKVSRNSLIIFWIEMIWTKQFFYNFCQRISLIVNRSKTKTLNNYFLLCKELGPNTIIYFV